MSNALWLATRASPAGWLGNGTRPSLSDCQSRPVKEEVLQDWYGEDCRLVYSTGQMGLAIPYWKFRWVGYHRDPQVIQLLQKTSNPVHRSSTSIWWYNRSQQISFSWLEVSLFWKYSVILWKLCPIDLSISREKSSIKFTKSTCSPRSLASFIGCYQVVLLYLISQVYWYVVTYGL